MGGLYLNELDISMSNLIDLAQEKPCVTSNFISLGVFELVIYELGPQVRIVSKRVEKDIVIGELNES